jgi:MFS family permease
VKREGMSAPLRQREFRLLFSGQCVSNLGDWLDFIALAVLIAYVWDMGPAALAALSIAIAIPWIFVAPFSGVLVDRWPKKQVLIGSDLVRAVVVAGLIFAPSLPLLVALVALKTTVATFFQPAEQATIRIIVAEAQLHQANALSQLVQQSTKVIGPALGGLIVAVASPRVAFGVDAATFLVSAAILARMRPIDDPLARGEDEADEGGYWAELR